MIQLFFAVIFFGCFSTYAEISEDLPSLVKKPLYEFGIGAGTGFFPHYPAARQGQTRSAAIPTIRYRGLFLRADEEDGVRAKIISDPRYGLELSGSGALPAASNDNDARRGMPDLDLLGEGGPQVYLRLHKESGSELRMLFPLRAAVSTDFSNIKYQGYTFSPAIDVRMLLPESYGALRIRFSAMFGSDEYQQYYYDVPQQYATVERSAYRASGGFMGLRTELGYSVDWGRFAVFTSFGYNDFRWSANTKSPLFTTEHTISGLIGFRWLLYESDLREGDKLW